MGARILRDLKATNVRLITNNPAKRVGLSAHGITISETLPISVKPNKINENYLKTKQMKMGHKLGL